MTNHEAALLKIHKQIDRENGWTFTDIPPWQREGNPMKKILYVRPIAHIFKAGDKIVDKTAIRLMFADIKGKVITVDGSNVEVRYTSGNTRWKKHINLNLDITEEDKPEENEGHPGTPDEFGSSTD